MLASYGLLAGWLVLHSTAILSLASPLLSERNNNNHLKCTNAPTVVAGYYVDPKAAQAPKATSATCQAQYQYLYCVPGTSTYIFFGTMKASLAPATSYLIALNSSIAYINKTIDTSPSGDGPIPYGSQYLTTSGTGVLIHGEAEAGQNLTWGVFRSALQGLNAWMAGTENGYSDATFQINDGSNQVGNGFIGADNQAGDCVFANAYVPNTLCLPVDLSGTIYGKQSVC